MLWIMLVFISNGLGFSPIFCVCTRMYFLPAEAPMWQPISTKLQLQ